MVKIELPFLIPFKSPRKRGNQFFNPLSEEKKKAQWLIRSQYCKPLLVGAVHALYLFEIGVPSSLSKKKKQKLLDEIECLKRIDIDNCMKFINDAMSKLIYSDDSQLTKITVYKHWAEADKTTVYLCQSQIA